MVGIGKWGQQHVILEKENSEEQIQAENTVSDEVHIFENNSNAKTHLVNVRMEMLTWKIKEKLHLRIKDHTESEVKEIHTLEMAKNESRV